MYAGEEPLGQGWGRLGPNPLSSKMCVDWRAPPRSLKTSKSGKRIWMMVAAASLPSSICYCALPGVGVGVGVGFGGCGRGGGGGWGGGLHSKVWTDAHMNATGF